MKPDLLQKAEKDIGYAKWGTTQDDEGYLLGAAFHIQQSIEKSVKTLLKEQGIDYLRTHDVLNLLARLPEGHPGLQEETFELLVDKAATLTSWEGNSRYTEGFLVMRKQVMSLLDLAEKVLEEVTAFVDTAEPASTDTEPKASLDKMNLFKQEEGGDVTS